MLLKFAYAETLSVESLDGPEVVRKAAHRAVFSYDPRPGYIYVRSRAISSRTNDNYDTFPGPELEQSWMTFIGRPVFVNHHNDDPSRARGVIIDAALHKDTALDGSEDTWVEVLQEIDARNFPKLAEAIINGDIERTSMGCDVAYSVCSFCGNKAATPLEYCAHIPRLKGKRIRRVQANGAGEDVLVHEICFGLKFFENSLLVEPPADPTAFFLGVDTRGLQMAAGRREQTRDDWASRDRRGVSASKESSQTTAANYGAPPLNATEVQTFEPPLKCKVTRAFNVAIGWGSQINRTGDTRVVVPAGTEGLVQRSWRESNGVLRLLVKFPDEHLQGTISENVGQDSSIVIDERFVDLMGGSIKPPAPPARDPAAKCPLSGERLRGYGYNDSRVLCPACGAMVKRTKAGYGDHRPGPQLDAPVCTGAGMKYVRNDAGRTGCPMCHFIDRSGSIHDDVPKHKPVAEPVLGALKWHNEADKPGQYHWIDESGDILVTYTGDMTNAWSLDIFDEDDGMADHIGDYHSDGEAFRAAEQWVSIHRTAALKRFVVVGTGGSWDLHIAGCADLNSPKYRRDAPMPVEGETWQEALESFIDEDMLDRGWTEADVHVLACAKSGVSPTSKPVDPNACPGSGKPAPANMLRGSCPDCGKVVSTGRGVYPKHAPYTSKSAKDGRDHGNTDKGNTTDRGYGWDHQKKREELLKGDPKCHWCHDAKATQADHTTGGKLVPSCAPCNNERSHEQQKRASTRNDVVYVVKPINEGLDAGWLTVGGPYEAWDYDAQNVGAGYAEAERDAAANPGSEIVDGEVYDSLHPLFAKLGYGEVKAPAQIDTLRIRECPVCGEEDSWDGDGRCRVCGYLPPPEPFRDPDLDVAQKADMREGPVNPAIFKAPPFVPPDKHDHDEEEDDKLDPTSQGVDPTLTFRSSHPVHPARTPEKVQSEGEPMSRPSVATMASQQAVIERQGEQIKLLRQQKAALLRRLADSENPAQPVSEPGSESPNQGTSNEDVRSADATTEVTTPGGVMDPPPPMATTTPTQPGAAASTDALLVANEAPTETTSVTAPVGNAGTQPPLSETKTEITPDTRGEAITPNFLSDDWANKAASIVRMTQEHTLASLRLARLRIQAGTARGDDLALAQRIAAEMELPAVRAEIKTLSAVAAARPAQAPAGRPVRTASRSMPSLVSAATPMQALGSRPSMDPSDDEFLFID